MCYTRVRVVLHNARHYGRVDEGILSYLCNCIAFTIHMHRGHTNMAICGNFLFVQVASNSTSTPFVLDGWRNEYADVAFLCKICKKSLPADRKNSWRAHYKTHSDIKEYVCNVCRKGFHTRFNMERHMKVHMKNMPNMNATSLVKDEMEPETSLGCNISDGMMINMNFESCEESSDF